MYYFRCSFLDYHVFLNIHPSETTLCQGHGHRRSPEKFKNKHIEALHFLPQKLSTLMCLIEPLAKNLMCLYKKMSVQTCYCTIAFQEIPHNDPIFYPHAQCQWPSPINWFNSDWICTYLNWFYFLMWFRTTVIKIAKRK